MAVMIVHRRIDRVQTGPLLGGRVRISHPYICQARSAQAMRMCMTKDLTLTTSTETARSKRQQPNKVGGGQLVESVASAVAGTQRRSIHQCLRS